LPVWRAGDNFSGVIFGWAALLDGKNALQTQSYGSSARGGACKCDVIDP